MNPVSIALRVSRQQLRTASSVAINCRIAASGPRIAPYRNNDVPNVQIKHLVLWSMTLTANAVTRPQVAGTRRTHETPRGVKWAQNHGHVSTTRKRLLTAHGFLASSCSKFPSDPAGTSYKIRFWPDTHEKAPGLSEQTVANYRLSVEEHA